MRCPMMSSLSLEQQEKDELSCLSIQQTIKSYGDSSLFMTKANDQGV